MDQADFQQNDEFEAMLDQTLRTRSQTGPRADFERRLAESLRQAHVSADPPRGWWNWLSASLSAAALAGLVAGSFVAFYHHHASGPQQASVRVQHHSSAVPQPVDVAVNVLKAPERPKVIRSPHGVSAAPRALGEHAPVVAETLPRLDTFPSPAPESSHAFGFGDPVAAISREAAQAMLGLQQQQARPITLAAINVNRPLFGESQ